MEEDLPLHLGNTYRHSSAPYPTRGHRIQRPRPHQHRTLHFNASSNTPEQVTEGTGTSSSTPASSGWVTRNDRHRQLINAKVFEKDSQTRTKAIEQTRKKKENDKRRGEKTRLTEFLKQHQSAGAGAGAAAAANTNTPPNRNELVVDGISFRVLDGGKKLVRVAGESGACRGFPERSTGSDYLDSNSSTPTPKSTVIAGVKFHRTKTGNLVVNRVVKDQRYVCSGRQRLMLTFFLQTFWHR